MKVAILGYGEQGRSAYEYWSALGAEITICDSNENLMLPANALSRLGADHLNNLAEYDLIVRSPIIKPAAIAAANNEGILDKVTSVTNEFFRVCPTKNIVGVTGTKGKGTTTTLIAKMLEAAGFKVHIAGNIGKPPLDLLKENIARDDWVILELANFQLIDIKYSPPIAVCLMVAPEHLDWHEDEAEYIDSKKQLFRHQTKNDIAIYYGLNPASKLIAAASPGRLISYMQPPGAEIINDEVVIEGQTICKVAEVKLPGRHNLQNVSAAVTALWQIDKNLSAARQVITQFAGMEHRLELIRELDGVKYYDDSFGTTPETAIVAIEAFEDPKVIILGGSDKGSVYTGLAQVVKNSNVKKAILIGKMGPVIQKDLETAGFSSFKMGGNTMTEIVNLARKSAVPGDIVLLSTACASFDMFKNYKDRAEQFATAVKSLS